MDIIILPEGDNYGFNGFNSTNIQIKTVMKYNILKISEEFKN